MIATLCILIPPLVWMLIRERVFQNHKSPVNSALCYAIGALLLNGTMMFVVYYILGNENKLVSQLNKHSDFAVKYIVLSLLLAVIAPYIERFVKEKISVEVTMPKTVPKFKHTTLVTAIYAVILFACNLIRIFDNNFWGDEAYSALLVSRNNIANIVSTTAADVHPPLYYLILKAGYFLFGDQGWMYHFVSLIPLIIILVLSLTYIRKKFGIHTSWILMTLAGLSANAVTHNVEVRMYSWGALFILLSFLCLHQILQEEKTSAYVWFTVFSLAAAYTHYYCLVSVAFFYVFLLFMAIRRKLSIKKVLVVCACTVVAYLPWLSFLIESTMEKAEEFWIVTTPTIRESLEYLFSSQFTTKVWYCIIIGTVFVIVYELGILSYETSKEKGICFKFNLEKPSVSKDLWWMIAGGMSIFGTIIFAILLSKLVRPFYVLRYIYPVSIVAWLLLGFCITKLKTKHLVTAALLIFMWITFIPAYKEVYTSDKELNDKLQTTLEATVDEIGEDDVILTNYSHIKYTLAKYYYSAKSCQKVDLPGFIELDQDTCYWLVYNDKQDTEDALVEVEAQGFSHELYVEDGNLGTHTIYIYKVYWEE